MRRHRCRATTSSPPSLQLAWVISVASLSSSPSFIHQLNGSAHLALAVCVPAQLADIWRVNVKVKYTNGVVARDRRGFPCRLGFCAVEKNLSEKCCPKMPKNWSWNLSILGKFRRNIKILSIFPAVCREMRLLAPPTFRAAQHCRLALCVC